MLVTYLISLTTFNIIYYFILTKFHEKKINNNIIIFGAIIIVSIVHSFLCLLNSPTINLLMTIFTFSCISYFCFEHNKWKDYLIDFINLFIVLILDGVGFLIFGTLFSTNANNELANIILTILSSVFAIVLIYIINKIVDASKVGNTPAKEIVLFIFVAIFHISIIGIVNLGVELYTNFYLKIIVLTVIVGVIITDFILIYYLDSTIKKNQLANDKLNQERQVDLTRQYYTNLKEKYDNQRRMIHDFNNHLDTITHAYEISQTEISDNIISEIKSKYSNEIIMETYSEILNIIVNDKLKKANENNIEFSFATDLVDLSFINEYDMITLFGNLYDNAIEANLKIDSDRMIETKISQHNSVLVITIKNNYNGTLKYINNEVMSTKENHKGVGLKNVNEIVEKHDGILNIKDKLGIFTITIAIPMVESK
ncbi:two-component system sensor histidine kinase AgrC [Bacilli bacterium PM5-3]|nr:two-component system sensor histidine kinase AgrC [Bacilli bacterium PM5-3]MDH6603981.1 two-component system sensor histidine kinase AgrC [Bacilli bacterium PM5-9]